MNNVKPYKLRPGVVFDRGAIAVLRAVVAEYGLEGTKINCGLEQVDEYGRNLPPEQVRAEISTEMDPKRNLWRLAGDSQLKREMELKETGRKEAK